MFVGKSSCVNSRSFNPFMPKAGVGRVKTTITNDGEVMFQSIYAQSRRWKFALNAFCFSKYHVSIHLCPKQALEVELLGIGNTDI